VRGRAAIIEQTGCCQKKLPLHSAIMRPTPGATRATQSTSSGEAASTCSIWRAPTSSTVHPVPSASTCARVWLACKPIKVSEGTRPACDATTRTTYPSGRPLCRRCTLA
jgi:hypothetical protein